MTLLKRYGNRRIYDTSLSRYVTLEELADRIRSGEDIKVIDSASGADITRRVLLQVVLLESLDIADVLPPEFLKTLIRLKDRGRRDLFGRYLRMTMEAFSLAQKQFEDNMRQMQDQMQATAELMKGFLSLGGTLPRFSEKLRPKAGETEAEAEKVDEMEGNKAQ